VSIVELDESGEVDDFVRRFDQDIDALQLDAQSTGFALVRSSFQHVASPYWLSPMA